MAKKTAQEFIDQLREGASLDILRQELGMSEKELSELVASSFNKTNLGSLGITGEDGTAYGSGSQEGQYSRAVADAYRGEKRNASRILKLMSKASKETDPDVRDALEGKIRVLREGEGVQGPVDSRINQGTPRENLNNAIQRLGAAGNTVVRVPGADATNTTGVIPLLGMEGMESLSGERNMDDEDAAYSNVFGNSISDQRDLSDQAAQSNANLRAAGISAEEQGEYRNIDEGIDRERMERSNRIKVRGDYDDVYVPDGETSSRVIGQRIVNLEQEQSRSNGFRAQMIQNEIDALTDALDTSNGEYFTRYDRAPVTYMDRDAAADDGFREVEGQTPITRMTREGPVTLVPVENGYVYETGSGPVQTSRTQSEIDLIRRSREAAAQTADYDRRYRAGELTEAEVRAVVEQDQRREIQLPPGAGTRFLGTNDDGVFDPAGATAREILGREIDARISTGGDNDARGNQRSRHAFGDEVVLDADAAVSNYNQNRGAIRRSNEERVLANQQQALSDGRIVDQSPGVSNLSFVRDMVVPDRYSPASDGSVVGGTSYFDGFFKDGMGSGPWREQENVRITDDAEVRPGTEDVYYDRETGSPIGTGQSDPLYDPNYRITDVTDGGMYQMSADEAADQRSLNETFTSGRKQGMSRAQIGSAIAQQRNISEEQAFDLLERRRLRLGSGLTARELIDLRPIPTISGVEVQVDIGGTLGELNRQVRNALGDQSVVIDSVESLQAASDTFRELKRATGKSANLQVGGNQVSRITNQAFATAASEGVEAGVGEMLNALDFDKNGVDNIVRAIGQVEKGMAQDVNLDRKAPGSVYFDKAVDGIIGLKGFDSAQFARAPKKVAGQFRKLGGAAGEPTVGATSEQYRGADGKMKSRTGAMTEPSELDGSGRNTTDQSGFGLTQMRKENSMGRITERPITDPFQAGLAKLSSITKEQATQENLPVFQEREKQWNSLVQQHAGEGFEGLRQKDQIQQIAASSGLNPNSVKQLKDAEVGLTSARIVVEQTKAVQRSVESLRVNDPQRSYYDVDAGGLVQPQVDVNNAGLRDARVIDDDKAMVNFLAQEHEYRQLENMAREGAQFGVPVNMVVDPNSPTGVRNEPLLPGRTTAQNPFNTNVVAELQRRPWMGVGKPDRETVLVVDRKSGDSGVFKTSDGSRKKTFTKPMEGGDEGNSDPVGGRRSRGFAPIPQGNVSNAAAIIASAAGPTPLPPRQRGEKAVAPPVLRVGTEAPTAPATAVSQEVATRSMINDPLANGAATARAQAPDVANSGQPQLLPAARAGNAPRPEVDSFFVLPQDARKREAFGQAARRDVSALPPVSPPSGAIDPGSFTNARTGERQSYGVGSPGIPQSAPQPITNDRPPGVTGGGGGRVFDERMGNYREPGGDITQERQKREQNSRRSTRRSGGRDLLRRVGRDAAVGALALGTGVGVGSLIDNEREEREGGRN